jgi:hypothetical protein
MQDTADVPIIRAATGAYTFPTEAPESDGTIVWPSTTTAPCISGQVARQDLDVAILTPVRAH